MTNPAGMHYGLKCNTYRLHWMNIWNIVANIQRIVSKTLVEIQTNRRHSFIRLENVWIIPMIFSKVCTKKQSAILLLTTSHRVHLFLFMIVFDMVFLVLHWMTAVKILLRRKNRRIGISFVAVCLFDYSRGEHATMHTNNFNKA